jgi:hypothetical protein
MATEVGIGRRRRVAASPTYGYGGKRIANRRESVSE